MARLYVRALAENGDVLAEAGYSDVRGILDNPADYPNVVIFDLQRKWNYHPWANAYTIRIDPVYAAQMVAAGTLKAEPSGWTFGYPHLYVGDGFTLCPACVEKQVRDSAANIGVDPEQVACELHVDDGGWRSAGETCDQCGQYIPGFEPRCEECGTADYELTNGRTLYTNQSGESRMCTRCLAEKIVKGEATRVPPKPYTYRMGDLIATGIMPAGVNTGYDTWR